MKAAFIGLGKMGFPIAGHLARNERIETAELPPAAIRDDFLARLRLLFGL